MVLVSFFFYIIQFCSGLKNRVYQPYSSHGKQLSRRFTAAMFLSVVVPAY